MLNGLIKTGQALKKIIVSKTVFQESPIGLLFLLVNQNQIQLISTNCSRKNLLISTVSKIYVWLTKEKHKTRKIIMKNTARISILLGLVALVGVLFYFQPKAEAKPVFENEIDLQNNLQQIIQQKNLQEQQIIQQNNQTNQQTNQQTNTVQKTEIQQDDEPNKEENSEMAVEARNFRATAYCLKGRTASGSSVRRGIVAADPRVLPLGTRIQLNAGSYSGTYTVADTGGAVKGRILDVWVPSCAEANRFGRKRVKVSVLSRKRKK